MQRFKVLIIFQLLFLTSQAQPDICNWYYYTAGVSVTNFGVSQSFEIVKKEKDVYSISMNIGGWNNETTPNDLITGKYSLQSPWHEILSVELSYGRVVYRNRQRKLRLLATIGPGYFQHYYSTDWKPIQQGQGGTYYESTQLNEDTFGIKIRTRGEWRISNHFGIGVESFLSYDRIRPTTGVQVKMLIGQLW